MFKRRRRILGWLTSPMVASMDGRAWRVERGFTMVIVLVSAGKKKVIEFNADAVPLELNTGEQIDALGLAACVNDDLRGTEGQKIPLVLSTRSIELEQRAGNAFGYAYCYGDGNEPMRVMHDGTWHDGINRLMPTGREGPGGPEHTDLQALSPATLRNHLPFCDPMPWPEGFSVLHAPRHASGIRSIGPFGDHSIVTVRVPADQVDDVGDVEPGQVSAGLRDGSTLPATGIVVCAHLPSGGPPFGIVDKAVIGPARTSLRGGGSFTFLHGYGGPFTAYSELDCKITAAFEKRADWESVEWVRIGPYVAELLEGTVVYEG